ncbi:hemerythrin-like metal-binding domain protein [Bacteriovorax sp. Seq25_V]|nr:hemerythrin-like metal-binding domain protein [Bacteriovorax sp. Seq25_V]
MLAIIAVIQILDYRKSKKVSSHLANLKMKIDSLSGVSDQISSTSSNLSEGAIEQAEQLHQTVSAMDQINATLRVNRDFTDESLRETTSCLEKVRAGQKVMSELGGAFSVIKDGNNEFEVSMSENTKEFDQIKNVISEISEKTKIINDIVFQTKLLSFNASVEAARAGEHGKGFAVVAEEVGNLANMSGEAAKEISAILESGLTTVNRIVDDTTNKVHTLIEMASRNIEVGSQSVEESMRTFNEIASTVDIVSAKIGEISRSTSEQAIGVEQISKAIYLLEQNNQRTTLVAKQAYQIASSLNDEFKELDESFESTYEEVTSGQKVTQVLADFKWDDKFLIGIDKVDEEHQELIEKINYLVLSLNDDDRSETMERFESLKNFTVFHFSEEEEFMRSINYPDYAAHKKIHENMLAKFGEYEGQLKSNTLDKKKFVAFLKNWLVSHILGVDTQYAKHSKLQSA